MISEWDRTPWQGDPAPAKAATGIGVAMLEYGTPYLIGNEKVPQRMMRRAQMAYHVNPWIRLAESTVTRRVVGLPWHLEDDQDEVYEDVETGPVEVLRDLIERPQMRLSARQPAISTRRGLWALTSRHVGLCGMAHWYLDQREALTGIPLGILYINPARMWPQEDEAGNLLGWMLDPKSFDGRNRPQGGVPLNLREVLTFYLDPPDAGNVGAGLYEAAALKSQITNLADQHSSYVLGTGGRIAGIVSPKEGSLTPDQFKTLEREFRNVNEAPDAAKRTTILSGPIDFTPTAADPTELNLAELSKMNRDDILALWGVPPATAGIPAPAGLNSGGTRGYDEAVLMQGAVHDRIVSIRETIQYGLLDGLTPHVELEIEEPEFDDRTPMYELLAKSREAPLTNAQRLAIIGHPPTGDPAIDNVILLPSTIIEYATIQDQAGRVSAVAEPSPAEIKERVEAAGALIRAGFLPAGALTAVGLDPIKHLGLLPVTVQSPPEPVVQEAPAKASRREFLGLRHSIDTRWVPTIRRNVADVLADQRTDVVARLRKATKRQGTDPDYWWNAKREDERLAHVLSGAASGIASTVADRTREVLAKPAKADTFAETVASKVARTVAQRVKGINDFTRKAIAQAVAEGFDAGLSPAEVATRLETLSVFDAPRAERIARTESMFAYNSAALTSYEEFGVTSVEAIDGDDDPECASRDGQTYSLAEAEAIEDHPNGTLDWVPVLGAA